MKNINHGRTHKGGRRVYASLHCSSYQASCLSPQWSEIAESQVRAFLGKQEIHSLALKSRISLAFGEEDTPHTPSTSATRRGPGPCPRTRHSTQPAGCPPGGTRYPHTRYAPRVPGEVFIRSLNPFLLPSPKTPLNKPDHLTTLPL